MHDIFHEDFEKEIYSVEQWVDVKKEGTETGLFDGEYSSSMRREAR